MKIIFPVFGTFRHKAAPLKSGKNYGTLYRWGISLSNGKQSPTLPSNDHSAAQILKLSQNRAWFEAKFLDTRTNYRLQITNVSGFHDSSFICRAIYSQKWCEYIEFFDWKLKKKRKVVKANWGWRGAETSRCRADDVFWLIRGIMQGFWNRGDTYPLFYIIYWWLCLLSVVWLGEFQTENPRHWSYDSTNKCCLEIENE